MGRRTKPWVAWAFAAVFLFIFGWLGVACGTAAAVYKRIWGRVAGRDETCFEIWPDSVSSFWRHHCRRPDSCECILPARMAAIGGDCGRPGSHSLHSENAVCVWSIYGIPVRVGLFRAIER